MVDEATSITVTRNRLHAAIRIEATFVNDRSSVTLLKKVMRDLDVRRTTLHLRLNDVSLKSQPHTGNWSPIFVCFIALMLTLL